MNPIQRPTSPHLSIYRPQISSVLSITHRMTGVALYAGIVVLALWLYTAAYAPAYYAQFFDCLSSSIGRFLLLGWTFSFFYHLSNGIRHLFWDMGKGYAIPDVNRSGWMVVFSAVIFTALIFGFIHSAQGGM